MNSVTEERTDTATEKKPMTRREMAYLAGILLAVVLIAAALLLHPRTKPDTAAASSPETAATEPEVVTQIVEVEKEVTVETLQDGLRDLGMLITEEYYFTDLVSFSSIRKFLKTDIKLPFTESSYLVSYDGVVNAGIDLSEATVEKDDGRKIITVHLPKAEIQAVTIDLESFELLEEKAGLGNRLSVEDFNNSLLELEDRARENAGKRGLAEKADANARLMVSRFIGSLVDTEEYLLEFAED